MITLLGGLALFLYGMRIMGDGLKESSTDALKKAMERITNNPFKSFLLGLAVTAVIQSSTATIVLTSGLVGAGILSLHQSVGIILGANVGTTVTGQIIRLLDVDASTGSILNFFKPSTLAPLAAIIGIVLIMASKHQKEQTIGKIAMGFGILFTGLMSMTGAITPLSETPEFSAMVVRFSRTPALGYLVGVVVSFILQSSSASIGILQALSMTGAFTFSSVYAIIIGIYLGDAATTAIVCSIGSKADAKRTGMIQCIFNISQNIILLIAIFILHRAGVLNFIWNETATPGIIANTNTIFNISCTILLLPMASVFEKLSRRIIKDDEQIGANIDREIGLLDEKLFASPALALSAAHEVICSMAKLAQEGVLNAMYVFEKYDIQAIDVIRRNEEHIDTLADRIDNYLVKLSPHVPTGHNNDLLNHYIQCFGEFERIGDYAVNLTENAQELKGKGEAFSYKAKRELGLLQEALQLIMEHAYVSFSKNDYEAAEKIEPVEEVVDDLVAELKSNHIRRLREGQCNIYAGLEFLDILVNVERIADQCSNVGVYTLALSNEEVMLNHHDYIQRLHQGTDPEFNRSYTELHQHFFDELEEIED